MPVSATRMLVARAASPSRGTISMPVSPPTLETARLRLRPLSMADLEALHAIQSDPVHMRFYPHPFSLDESRVWIERMQRALRARRASRCWRWRIARRGSSWGTSAHTFSTSTTWTRWSSAGRSRRRAARQGIATEAAVACRDWAFATLRFDHLISLILPENAPSRGVAEHLGMRCGRTCSGVRSSRDPISLPARPAGRDGSRTQQLAHAPGNRHPDRAVIRGFEVDPVNRAGRDEVPQIQQRDHQPLPLGVRGRRVRESPAQPRDSGSASGDRSGPSIRRAERGRDDHEHRWRRARRAGIARQHHLGELHRASRRMMAPTPGTNRSFITQR